MNGSGFQKKFYSKDYVKKALMTVMVLLCLFSIYYFHVVLCTEVLFTHFFYIPIILAIFWWKRKGLIVPGFFGLILIAEYFTRFETAADFSNNIARASIFIVVGIMITYLVERMDKVAKEKEISANFAKRSE
ncbi:MAG: hypothetical protein U9Q34_03790, partial [Elusimicrobiota bacterium]|nr:hypothetical protein [Elusimicrobiota bacterium]